jgi:hypothetical protein
VEQFTVLEGALSILRFGGRDGIRTHDLLIAVVRLEKYRAVKMQEAVAKMQQEEEKLGMLQ